MERKGPSADTSSFMQALKKAHSGKRAVYTLGKCHMEVLCGCVYICVEGIFHMEKKNATLVDNRLRVSMTTYQIFPL